MDTTLAHSNYPDKTAFTGRLLWPSSGRLFIGHCGRWRRSNRTAGLLQVAAVDGLLSQNSRFRQQRRTETFHVSVEETLQLASESGLRCILNVETESAGELNRRAEITWSPLAFVLEKAPA